MRVPPSVFAALLLLAPSAFAQSGEPTPIPTGTPEATPTPTEAPARGAPSGATTTESKGGLSVRTEDGRFEFNVGTRVHFDAVSLHPDDAPGYAEEGGTYFRRARLTLYGKLDAWDWKLENDFADAEASTSVDCDDSTSPPDCEASTVGTTSFREVYLARKLPYVPGARVTLGQFKPLRGMEELTSSNEITMIERPIASASGIFSGRQWAMGAKVEGGGTSYTWGLALQNNSVLKGADSRTTEQPLVSGRVTYAPLSADRRIAHVGLSASLEDGNPLTGARLRGRGKLPATDLGTSRTLAEAGAATNAEDRNAFHAGLELAGAFGIAYLQAEYVRATFTDAYDDASGGPEDATVTAYYVMASVFVTGESKPYKGGVFRSPKPLRSALGAIELKARYDFARNEDQPEVATNERQVGVLTVGTNWYASPNVRFMLEYSMADDRTTQVDGDFVAPTALTFRSQFHF